MRGCFTSSVVGSALVFHSRRDYMSGRNRCRFPVISKRWSGEFRTTTAATSVSESCYAGGHVGPRLCARSIFISNHTWL